MTTTSTYRWSVASRAIAAIVGGYMLTSFVSIAVSLLLAEMGVNKAEAVLAMSMASFLIYAVVIMAVFTARTPTRAWVGLVIASIPPALFYAFYHGGGG